MFSFFINSKLRGQWTIILVLNIIFITLFFNNDFSFVISQNDGPFYIALTDFLKGNILIGRVITLIIIIGSGMLFDKLVKTFNMLPRKNHTVFLIWLLLIIAFPALWNFNPVIVAGILIIYSFLLIFNATKTNLETQDIITISLLFSLSALIYKPFIFFVLFIPLILLAVRQFKLKSLLVSLLIFILPFIWLWSWYFINGKPSDFYEVINYNITGNTHCKTFNDYHFLFPFILLMILFLFSFGKLIGKINNKLIHVRVIFNILIVFMVFTSAIAIISPLKDIYIFYFLFFPLSIIISTGLLDMKSPLITDIYLLLFLMISIYITLY